MKSVSISACVLYQYQPWNHTATTVGGKRQLTSIQTVRCSSIDGALPVAAISGSLPWRSASSHWYKATDETHAEKHRAKKQKKTKMEAMLKQMHNNEKQISQWNDKDGCGTMKNIHGQC